MRCSRIFGLILLLLLLTARADAFEAGLGFGPLLPSRIGGVSDIMNGWATRATLTTSKGSFEPEYFNAHGGGAHYHSLALDYRLDLADNASNAVLPVHLALGFHVDYYMPSNLPSYKTSGGWHYGGGFHIPLGSGPDGFALRADFKHRFSPGSSLIVLVGISFSTDSSAAETP